jgi:hypothetical protein
MATPGQPTLYKPEYCELAHNYCLLGGRRRRPPARACVVSAIERERTL